MNIIDQFRLDGRVALVTGGAGLFGRQIVECLCEAGARTFVASRNMKVLQQQVERWQQQGLHVNPLPLDQSDEGSVQRLLETLAGETDGVDVLVNNAVARPMKSWDDPAEHFEQSMRINMTGMFLMHRVFGNHMAARGNGSIINIGSIQGMVGPDLTLYEGLGMTAPPDYFMHKGALIQLTRCAAAQFGTHGVRVNMISPGGFFNEQDQRFVQRYANRTLLKRMAGNHDLKGAVVFLASDASAYLTAVNIPVDGGYTAI